MLVLLIPFGFFFLLSAYRGDVWGALTFAEVILVLSWALWGEEKKTEK